MISSDVRTRVAVKYCEVPAIHIHQSYIQTIHTLKREAQKWENRKFQTHERSRDKLITMICYSKVRRWVLKYHTWLSDIVWVIGQRCLGSAECFHANCRSRDGKSVEISSPFCRTPNSTALPHNATSFMSLPPFIMRITLVYEIGNATARHQKCQNKKRVCVAGKSSFETSNRTIHRRCAEPRRNYVITKRKIIKNLLPLGDRDQLRPSRNAQTTNL